MPRPSIWSGDAADGPRPSPPPLPSDRTVTAAFVGEARVAFGDSRAPGASGDAGGLVDSGMRHGHLALPARPPDHSHGADSRQDRLEAGHGHRHLPHLIPRDAPAPLPPLSPGLAGPGPGLCPWLWRSVPGRNQTAASASAFGCRGFRSRRPGPDMMIRDVPARPGFGPRCSPTSARRLLGQRQVRKKGLGREGVPGKTGKYLNVLLILAGSLPALQDFGARSASTRAVLSRLALLQAQGLGAQPEGVLVARSCWRVCSTADRATTDSSFKLSVLTRVHSTGIQVMPSLPSPLQN